MSRPIKVRIWEKSIKRYMDLATFTITNDGEITAIANSRTLEPVLDKDNYILEQYTGLKDKNGKEIYEGDVMRYDAIDYQVLWSDYYASFETKRINSEFLNEGLTLHFLARVGRVVGNIHENKALLGGEE